MMSGAGAPCTAASRSSRILDPALLIAGAGLMSVGLVIYDGAQLVAGGLAGLALLADHLTGIGFPPIYLVLSAPFWLLAIGGLGLAFTLRTAFTVTCISLFTQLAEGAPGLDAASPFVAALGGGGLMGAGLFLILRQRSSIGGFNILAVRLNRTLGFGIGRTLLTIDCIILGAALLVHPLAQVLASILGAIVINGILILAQPHLTRAGRSA